MLGFLVDIDGPQALPVIPEPMFFDLVRPLGARKGELEFNSLFLQPLRGSRPRLEWAPELEYAVADGFAIEPQIVFDGHRFVGGQFTGQKTIGPLLGHRAGHGVLGRGEYLKSSGISAELLYLFGARLNKRWSIFTIQGLRRDGFGRDGFFQALLNPSLFCDATKTVTLGIETNFAIGRREQNISRFIPQTQIKLPGNTQLQCGVGLSQRNHVFSPSLIARVVWQAR